MRYLCAISNMNIPSTSYTPIKKTSIPSQLNIFWIFRTTLKNLEILGDSTDEIVVCDLQYENITMPSSNDNIPLGDKVHGKYNTAALHDIMVKALKLQICSRLKIDSASEFIYRTYFLETINGAISQRPHVDSRFNYSTNRNPECTESFWSANIPITPLGMELNVWPNNASPSNVCKPIRLKVKLGQFILRSPSVVHGGSYPGQCVHMAIATNRSQRADIDDKSPSIVTKNEDKVDYIKSCLPREHDNWE